MKYTTERDINCALGLLCGIGGAIGYAKSKSIPSLVAGSVFGILYCTSAYLLKKNENKLGLGLSLVTSSLLVGAMGRKAITTKKPVPIIMSTGALITGVVNGTSLYSLMKEN